MDTTTKTIKQGKRDYALREALYALNRAYYAERDHQLEEADTITFATSNTILSMRDRLNALLERVDTTWVG